MSWKSAGLPGSKGNNKQSSLRVFSKQQSIPKSNSRAHSDASPTRFYEYHWYSQNTLRKFTGNSNLVDTTNATASAKRDLGNTEILHRQLTAEYLIPHYLGLVRMTSIILIQFKWVVEKAERVQQNGYMTSNRGQIIYENRFGSWSSLVWWRLRDILAWIPEQQLQNVQPCEDVTKAWKSSSQK